MNKINQILNKLAEYNNKKNFTDYLSKIKKNGKILSNKSLNEIELNKCKMELAKKYYLLGKYISKKCITKAIMPKTQNPQNPFNVYFWIISLNPINIPEIIA